MSFSIKLIIFLVLNTLTFGCASAQNAANYDNRMAAIESLRAFEIAAHANPSLLPPEPAISKASSFECDESAEYNCETQKLVHRWENEQEPVLYTQGKFKVTIHFKNDNHFPIRYIGKPNFENVVESKTEGLTNRIFEHYLGANYSSLSPEFVNSYYDVVGMSVLVSSSDELGDFIINDSRVHSISHIGNPEELEEGY